MINEQIGMDTRLEDFQDRAKIIANEMRKASFEMRKANQEARKANKNYFKQLQFKKLVDKEIRIKKRELKNAKNT